MRDEIIRAFEYCKNHPTCDGCDSCKYGGRSFMTCERLADDILALLKEQDELLHKKQKDVDRLCNEISEWKQKYHDKLLKEQEPRVMTLEEVKGMKRLTICAVEQRSKVIENTFNAEYGGIVTHGNKNFLDFGLYGDTNRYRRMEARYGKTWRCWSARPTEEQRKAVKWND